MEIDPLLGQQMKGYRVTKLLGEGGMGRVYRAEHPVIGKSIAIKLLHAHMAQEPETLARFLQEAKAANQIRHDNIVDIIDFESSSDGKHFLLMEYLEGKTLEEALQKESPMAPVRLAKIGLQLCSALYAAHQKGIIHRDLKPENVFLITHAGRTDFVKVLDFGVAKVLQTSSSSPKTQVGAFIGSPICVSPEQALGIEVDGRADLYSLGVLLYHMATGQPPFPGKESLVLLSQHLSETPIPPRQKNPNISQPLEAVILRCLEKNREQRYASMKELAKALADSCGVEMIPFFTAETVAPEIIQTTPNIVVSTRKLPSAEEEKIRLTPLANPPAVKKAAADLLPTTQMQSSPKIDLVSPLGEHPEEEWKLSTDGAETAQGFDTMQQLSGELDGSTVEHLKAQKSEATKKTKSLEEVSQEGLVPAKESLDEGMTNVAPRPAENVVLSKSLEQMSPFDIRQLETEHHLPSVKSAHPEIMKELSNAMKAEAPPENDAIRRLETVEIAQVQAFQKEVAALPQPSTKSLPSAQNVMSTIPEVHKLPTSEHELMSLPSLSMLTPKKNPLPWILLGAGSLLFIALLYLLLG